MFLTRADLILLFFCRNTSVDEDNLDVKGHAYYDTQRDIAETKIHHLLSENLFMPRNKVRVVIVAAWRHGHVYWAGSDVLIQLHNDGHA